jgi:hypothetical protein
MYCGRARETPSAATGVPFGLKIARNRGMISLEPTIAGHQNSDIRGST